MSHAFALNGNENDPYIHGYEEVINTYKRTLQDITLSGPTLFGDLLRKQIEIIKNSRDNLYHILLILTDGEVNDYDETVQLLIEASRMPLSILIVGVGFENFKKMEKLDGDQLEILNKRGDSCARDIVQFVNYRKYKHDLSIFSREALMEIPTQLMNYMKFKSEGKNI